MFVTDKHKIFAVKRPLIGIAFIFLLQAAFIAYTAVNRIYDSSVSVVTVRGAGAPERIVPDETLRELGRIDAQDFPEHRRFVAANHREPRLFLARPEVFVPAKFVIHGRVQLIPRERTVEKDNNYRPALFSETQPTLNASFKAPRKRSFFARTLSLFKKPVDLIKSLASHSEKPAGP